MIHARRFPQPPIRWTCLVVCFGLVLGSLVISPLVGASNALTQGRGQPRNDKARKVKAPAPEKTLPFSNLPNLKAIKRQPAREPESPPSFSSSVRSKSKPLESRKGRRVGDPGTGGARGVGRNPTGTESNQRIETAGRAKTDRDERTRHHAKKSGINNRKRSAAAQPILGDDQYIQNFFYWALLRSPNSSELSYWNDILRTAHAQAAYAQGQSALQIATREMGRTIFESAEYAARNRDAHWYVYDLYKTFLMRDPDSGGWAYWEALVPTIGRAGVRHGFEYSTEFANLVATIIPNGAASGNAASVVSARVDPFNQTGNHLRARDCEWNLSLISLPGRAGLNLGLGLSYSSMVWTRTAGPSDTPYLYFDEDNSSISPGFRLGFAAIQGPSFDAQTGRNVYMLISSSGQRVELRQIGTSTVYEAGDSSYLQLQDNGGSLLLRTTDGTQMTYGWFDFEWRVTQVKDRNGNYLTVTNDWRGDIQTITDTLGRVINFNYDGNANLTSISQWWNGGWHTWATFGWGATHTMNASAFTGALVVGTYTGESIPVLRQVGLHDGSYFTFEYTGAAQVNVIRSYRTDNVQSAYTAYDYNTPANDCPRISQTRVWAENWTGVNGVPAEVATQFSLPGDGSHQMVAPDGTMYREYYGTGWQKGLVTQNEVWSGGVRQKWITLAYTQDNTSVGYQTNPRITETNVYDGSNNRRRTTIDYGPYASYGLPNAVVEYQADGTSLLRVTFTDYNLSQTYLDRRIIGLVSAVHVSDGQWQSKTTYGYDSTSIDAQATAATMHDQNYHASFTTRGNLTSVSRWDVNDIGNSSKALTNTMSYNAAGSVLSTTDPSGHTNSVNYSDSFSDGNNSRNTFAYPTTTTDAGGFSSYLQYNFDFAATTRVQGPPPAGQSQGAIQTLTYDSAARVQQVTMQNTGAYTRYVYAPNHVKSFSTVNNVADEAYSVQVFDGAGHVFGTANNHPGSVGGYRLAITIYDHMGRAKMVSNPFEVNDSWSPTGDDAAGVFFSQQTYNWQGKPLVTTNQDGTQKYASYAGCGCAGGEVVTLTDEVGRQQKVYSDVLGRSRKTEVLNWNGSVYSTTTNTFNSRDQVTLVRQWAGVEGSGTYQDTTMSYDGYGRLQSKHVPEQNAGTATVYAYNADDTIQSVTDARGSYATYGYNSRHLVTGIVYTPSSGVPATPSVSYNYDAAGNRTLMTDGVGTHSYTYNQLSQITSESRSITGLNNYTISYDYNLAGQVKSITDPASATINYGFDSLGRLNSVTGSPFGGVTSYLSAAQYRAWGAVKHLDYSNSRTMDAGFNNRMQVSSFNIPGIMTKTYQYNADARLSFSGHAADHRFDRSYSYDQVARLTEALSGAEARGEGTTNDRPYNQTFTYDALSHLTNRNSKVWTWQSPYSTPETYTNNRSSAAVYDVEGNQTSNSEATYSFDAAGNIVTVSTYNPQSTTARTLDGNGQQLKTVTSTYNEASESWTNTTTYYIRSTVLGGQVLTELNEGGNKQKTFVYANGEVLARQEIFGYQNLQGVYWEHRDPANVSYRTTQTTGDIFDYGELDPLGADVTTNPIWYEPNPPDDGTGSLLPYPTFGNPTRPGVSYSADGIPVSTEYFMRALEDNYHGSFSGGSLSGEMRARARAAEQFAGYTVSTYHGRLNRYFGSDFRRAGMEAIEQGHYTVVQNWIVSDVNSGSLFSFVADQPPQEPVKIKEFTAAEHIVKTTAFTDAARVLAGKDCQDWFVGRSGKTLREIQKLLSKLGDNAQVDDSPSSVASISPEGVLTLHAVFFLNDNTRYEGGFPEYFWHPKRREYVSYGDHLTPRQNRASTVLHELAHLLKILPDDSVIATGSVEKSAEVSGANSALIVSKCGKYLRGLPRR